MWDYTDKVRDYFFNPVNAGVLETANAVGEVGAISCGDALKLMMKVDPETEIIEAAKFQTFGCGSAIASSSALTEIILGKTLDEALKITNQDIADFLGGLPPEKMHCSVMGYEALQAAVADYRGEVWSDDHEEGALVCKCFGVDEGMIERAVRSNKLTTPEAVTNFTKAGGGCLTCFERIEGVLAKVNEEMVGEGLLSFDEAYRIGSVDPRSLKQKAKPKAAVGSTPVETAATETRKPVISLDALEKAAAATVVVGSAAEAALQPAIGLPRYTTVQKIKLIEEALEEIRPVLKKDGGDCELIDVDGANVIVKLSGACVGCQMASMTINGVQEKIVAKLGIPVRVVPVK
ncbi:Fe-S cluster assembly protein NifU [Pinisolibacter aquiterrae]|uniref:Fe-S cluster assembly protein NifU n=1 Tax=Pinisolibacter aquiterrae TaxID=2815579 RepID=UPI001C3D68DF|nr:Fe-S cluster assembly protein NifU [Pinisolibacter aquiterrae]MBV5266337.1 Fe-S cluster assembly protein NifU [Pinisolibacter aquiterrae]MCC8236484.1 Fe-S cluster assembly protein NifU [Pinisolibacter aquiterrae]